MFFCEIWLFDWYFPQFCTSDMSKYGYLEVFQGAPSSRLYDKVKYLIRLYMYIQDCVANQLSVLLCLTTFF